MNFGLFADFHVRDGMTQEDAFDESFHQVDLAEQLGMDSVWLAEHHFNPQRSVLASPLIVASAIASRTHRMRVGLAVQVLPLTNPLRSAEEAATVDHISKGRLDFGVGRSGIVKSYRGYNVDYSESRGRFMEALDVITRAWSEDQFSYQGEYYTYNEVSVVPKPYQTPYPPVRVAVASADTYPLMGRLGHPIFISANSPLPELQDRLEQYRTAWAEAGHPGSGDLVLRIPTYVAETAEQARSEPEASTMRGIRYLANELASAAASQETAERMLKMADASYEEILRRRVMYGTPEAIIDRLKRYEEDLGISGVVMEMNYGGQVAPDRVINSIRLLTEKVAPEFK